MSVTAGFLNAPAMESGPIYQILIYVLTLLIKPEVILSNIFSKVLKSSSASEKICSFKPR